MARRLLGRGLDLGALGDEARRDVFARLKAGQGAVLPTIAMVRPWFDELAVDREDVASEEEEAAAEAAEAEEERSKDGGDDDAAAAAAGDRSALAETRRLLPAAALGALLRRVWAHAEPAFEGSALLQAAAQRAFEEALADCVAEGCAPMSFRSFVDNPLGCVHEALWELLQQDDH